MAPPAKRTDLSQPPLFDVVKKNVDNLMPYIMHKKVKRVVKSKYYYDMFPIYASIIQYRFVKAMKRKAWLHQVEVVLADFSVSVGLPNFAV